MRAETVIRAKNVTKQYRDSVVLRRVDLSVRAGEFLVIVGPSGSGKSTLLHVLGGIDSASSGELSVCGRDIGNLKDSEMAKFRNEVIGFVFQFFYLQPHMCVAKNLEVPMMPARMGRQVRAERARMVARLVGIENKLSEFPKSLSGGELQRVAIARAIINEPRIILADEPTGNLDDNNTRNIIRLLLDIKREKNTALVVVTHDERIARMADRVLRLTSGVLTDAKV